MTAGDDASGGFRHWGWWIHTPGDDPRSAQYASSHESHHRQVQDSTTFGALIRVLDELGGSLRRPDVVTSLNRVSTQVQEAFASWAPVQALGWTRAELVVRYPAYGGPFDAMAALVAGAGGPYLRFHAAHACARACMQSPSIEAAVAVGLERFTLAALRSTHHPDRRFDRLRHRPPDWVEVRAALDDELGGDDDWRRLRALPALTAGAFAPALADLFQVVNRIVYGAVAARLRSDGFPVLGHDDQLAWTPVLLSDAARVNGGPVALEPGGPRDPEQAPRLVLRGIESEGFEVAGRLPARLLDAATTSPADLLAGLEDPHLFLTIRATEPLWANYGSLAPPSTPVGAFLRRTVAEGDDARVVELLDVTDSFPRRREDAPFPVVTAVALSLMNHPLADRFRAFLSPETATVLLDLPLEPHLRVWLRSPGTTFRHVLLRTEAAGGRVVPVLVATLATDAATSHLLLRPLSHAAARIYPAAFEEMDPAGRSLVEDPEVVDLHPELLHLSLAHLSGEEVRFGPPSRNGAPS